MQLDDGRAIAIDLVRVGDRVWSANSDGEMFYSTVVSVPHKKNDFIADFVYITTATGVDLRLRVFVHVAFPVQLTRTPPTG